jgi:cytochrome P450
MRWPLLGDLPDLYRDVTGTFATLARTRGPRADMWLGLERALVLSDPEDAKHVLLQSAESAKKSRYTRMMSIVFGNSVLIAEGDDWKRQRGYLNPLFSPKAAAQHAAAIREEAVRFCHRLADDPALMAQVNISDEARRLVQKIMGRILFGDLFPQSRVDSLMDDLQVVNDKLFGEFIRKSILRGPLGSIPTPGSIALKRATKAISAFIDDLLKSDLPETDASMAAAIVRAVPEGPTRANEIKDQITVLFYAGQDTTARALAWTLLFLAERPAEAAKIRAEARSLDAGDLADSAKSFPFTLRVVRESLRLRPVAYAIDRQLDDPTSIGCPYAQANVIAPIAVSNVHRHPDHWRNPDEFDPERFSPEQSAGRHPCAFIPFGHGARKCVGASLAELELVIILSEFCRRFEFGLVSKGPIRAKAAVTLAPHPAPLLRLRQAAA